MLYDQYLKTLPRFQQILLHYFLKKYYVILERIIVCYFFLRNHDFLKQSKI
jgi:hypothetical protein